MISDMGIYKNNLYRFWTYGYYTFAQMRQITTKNGTTKKFSYVEFKQCFKITVEEYDANVDFFADMKYSDWEEWYNSESSPNLKV